jgi:hypothetical protein
MVRGAKSGGRRRWRGETGEKMRKEGALASEVEGREMHLIRS